MLLISSSLNFLGHFPEIHNLITERGSNFQKELFFFAELRREVRRPLGKYFRRFVKKALKFDPLPLNEQRPNKDNGKEGMIDRNVEFWFSCF